MGRGGSPSCPTGTELGLEDPLSFDDIDLDTEVGMSEMSSHMIEAYSLELVYQRVL